MKRIVFVFIIAAFVVSALAQQRSVKRGVCWDEKTQQLTDAPIQKMAPGVAWLYNWGIAPTGSPTTIGTSMQFVPMCWNGDFDETRLREYLTLHEGEVRYLLGYNEPNFGWAAGGSNMTPQQAADAWPKVQQVATDFGLQLVAPALNFTGDKVGGRVWTPFEWYDEFFRLCPDAAIDYLAFHSYMNYYSAVDWLCTEYFYSDKEDSDLFHASNKGRYPHLVKYLEDYKAAHGHFPKMFLTEFCSWSTGDYPYSAGITRDFQIDQMVQKLQKLEQSDLVAGYAWFMGNTSGGEGSFPYMSIFKSNVASSELSTLGQVYVYMSSFDRAKFYAPGENILAKDYVDASLDAQVPKVRPNTESGSDIPLQVEWQSGSWTAYQVSLPADGDYTLTLHMCSTAANDFRVYLGALGAKNKKLDTTLPSTNGEWADVTTTVKLSAGSHTLLLYNMGESPVLLNSLRFDSTSGITAVRRPAKDEAYYTLTGRRLSSAPQRGIYIHNGHKMIVK